MNYSVNYVYIEDITFRRCRRLLKMKKIYEKTLLNKVNRLRLKQEVLNITSI